MRHASIAALAASILLLAAAPLAAQDGGYTIRVSPQGPDPRQLPRDVADEVIHFFNAPGTLHFSGITRIPAARGIDGDVAVLGGPVTVAGRISGSLHVINGDLILEDGAVIGGDILVVGGDIEGQSRASIAGETRSYRNVLRYRRAGDDLVYAPQRDSWRRTRRYRSDESTSGFVLSLGGTYNRIEGAPIVFGPRLNLRLNEGSRFVGDARLILRTGENFSFDKGRFGYRAQGEVLIGSRLANVGVGVTAYDKVDAVEPWPLRDFEAGWAAFLLHNDYRDWYRQQGWSLYAALRPSRRYSLGIEGRDERHFSEAANDPWTLFKRSDSWRANPQISDGDYRSLLASLRVDTRNERTRPSSGVYLNAEFEAGQGRNVTGMLGAQPAAASPALADGKLTYQRAWVDARTYLRVTPAGRLNLRVAGGGKIGGEELPNQRRTSLGFPDPMPGYRFRQLSCGGGAIAGNPALCDASIVAQAELRTHLGFDFGPDWANDWGDDSADEAWQPLHVSGPDIVVFADAGYAWSVGTAAGQIPSGHFPGLRNWLPDVGIGLDIGPLGFYVAKSIGTQAREDLTFTVRLGRRF